MTGETIPEQQKEPETPHPTSQPTFFRNWLPLALILVVLAAGFLWIGLQQQQSSKQLSMQRHLTAQQIATNQQQDTLLSAYMDKISDLLVHDNLIHGQPTDIVTLAANAYTLDTLPRLDANHKAILMRFLYQTKLISNDSHVISMREENISGIHLSNDDLRDTYLVGANFSNADLHGTILSDTILLFANLRGANLSHTDLHASDMRNADLTGTDLSGANLRDVIGLQNDQLAHAKSLKGATMPDGTVHP
ncbi:MAG TPA: pentapeptide repeat-containing protein [Dictyobacter sp.]|nr:pentapeptide repeat-containing protein [Dictyobacter sp.]